MGMGFAWFRTVHMLPLSLAGLRIYLFFARKANELDCWAGLIDTNLGCSSGRVIVLGGSYWKA